MDERARLNTSRSLAFSSAIDTRPVGQYYTDWHYTTWCNFDIMRAGKDSEVRW